MGNGGWGGGSGGGKRRTKGSKRERSARLELARHQPQPLPPPPRLFQTALSAPPAKRVLLAAAPIPGAESRVRAPPLAGEGGCRAQSRSAHRPRVPTRIARPLRFRAAPARWRGGGGGDWREFRPGNRRRAFPTRANGVLASGAEQRSGRLLRAPWLRGRLAGRSCGRDAQAGQRSVRGPMLARDPWIDAGVAHRGGDRREEEEEEEEDGEAADAERRRPGCRGGRLCVVTLCATC